MRTLESILKRARAPCLVLFAGAQLLLGINCASGSYSLPAKNAPAEKNSYVNPAPREFPLVGPLFSKVPNLEPVPLELVVGNESPETELIRDEYVNSEDLCLGTGNAFDEFIKNKGWFKLDYLKTIDMAKKLLQKNPKNLRALFDLAFAEQKIDMYDDSIQHYTDFIMLVPFHSEIEQAAKFNRGLARHAVDDYSCIDDFEIILDNPKYKAAQSYLLCNVEKKYSKQYNFTSRELREFITAMNSKAIAKIDQLRAELTKEALTGVVEVYTFYKPDLKIGLGVSWEEDPKQEFRKGLDENSPLFVIDFACLRKTFKTDTVVFYVTKVYGRRTFLVLPLNELYAGFSFRDMLSQYGADFREYTKKNNAMLGIRGLLPGEKQNDGM